MALILLPLACSQPTIDASSQEAFSESVDRIARSLPKGRRILFHSAIAGLLHDRASAPSLESLIQALDGKTAGEVIALFESSQEEAVERANAYLVEHIQELEAKRDQAENLHREIGKIKVPASRLFLEKPGGRPLIELTVENATGRSISGIHFRGILKSPDRAVPWVEDTFYYQASGGIEPGETRSWTVPLSFRSRLASVVAATEGVLTVIPYGADGPDGKPLFLSEGLTAHEQRLLRDLRSRLRKNLRADNSGTIREDP